MASADGARTDKGDESSLTTEIEKACPQTAEDFLGTDTGYSLLWLVSEPRRTVFFDVCTCADDCACCFWSVGCGGVRWC
jgi:hypothetical protein